MRQIFHNQTKSMKDYSVHNIICIIPRVTDYYTQERISINGFTSDKQYYVIRTEYNCVVIVDDYNHEKVLYCGDNATKIVGYFATFEVVRF